MSTITLSRSVIEYWSKERKMDFADVVKNLAVDGSKVTASTFQEVESLSEKLVVPLEKLFKSDVQTDLDDGVKICRADEGFVRTSERKGKKYYKYHHLAITNTLPNLMPLRVVLYCSDEADVVLNGGHASYEFIYVTKGVVRMHWDIADKGMISKDLFVGDSVYIHPGVSHSFMAVEDESELIAVNF